MWRELGEQGFNSETALAHELKQATQRIKSVSASEPEAYDIMWQKSAAKYDDASSSVLVKEDDCEGLMGIIDEVEATYSELEELGQLDTLTVRDVDRVTVLLITHVRVEWIRKYHDL